MRLNRIGTCLLGAMIAFALMAPKLAAQPSLGTAANFAVLANSGITNTGPTVIVGGNVGSGPTTPAITGFTPPAGPGVVTPPAILYLAANPVTAQANADLGTAYAAVAAMGPTQTFPNGDGQLNNLTLGPGVYRIGSATTAQLAAGTLTLDAGNVPGAVFIFQVPGTTLITAAATHVLLTRQAQACNVFWQVGSSATLGAASTFVGNIMANTSITVGNSATVAGRLLAGAVAPSGAATLSSDQIVTSACAPIPPPPPPSTGSIQVVKNVTAGSPDATFAFTSNFGLVAQMTTNNGSVSSPWVMNLNPGSNYMVSETAPTGWTQTSAVCSNGTPSARSPTASPCRPLPERSRL
jgi:hypothetical protein